jgi:hypothetical protein
MCHRILGGGGGGSQRKVPIGVGYFHFLI